MKKISSYVAVLCSAIATSCSVDESYDFDRLVETDPEVTIFEKGLQLPLLSEADINLMDVLSGIDGIGLGDYIVSDRNGDYSMKYDGSYTGCLDAGKYITREVRGQSRVCHTDFRLIDTDLPLPDKEITVKGEFERPLAYVAEGLIMYDVSDFYEFPEGLGHIDSLVFEDGVSLKVGLALSGLPPMPDGKVFTMKDIKITLPENVDTGDGNGSGNVVSVPDQAVILSSGIGRISVTVPVRCIRNFDVGRSLSPLLTIGLEGTLCVADPTFNVSDLTSEIKADLIFSFGDTADVFSEDPGIVTIHRIAGKIQADLSDYIPEQELDMAELSGFMSGKDIRLDVNPTVCLTVSTNLGIPAVCDLVLTPLDADGNVLCGPDGTPGIITLKNIACPCSISPNVTSETKIMIGENVPSEPGCQAFNVNLSELLNPFPAKIGVRFEGMTDSGKTAAIEPSAQYFFNAGYSLDIPLEFGDNFKSGTYTTEFDLDESLWTYLSMADFSFDGDILSTYPVGVRISAAIIDGNGMPVSFSVNGEDTTVLEMEIAPNLHVDALSDDDFWPVISFGNSSFSTPCKIRLSLELLVEPDIRINDKDLLSIENLSLKLTDGITIDPMNFFQ